jgi:molybdate transport system substrate-binding protein
MLVLFCCATWSPLFAQMTVAAASSMQNALKEMQTEFAKETGKTFAMVFGASGKLTAQIKNGAPFDVFMSADMAFPESLAVAKLTDSKPVVYARGTLVLWSLKDSNLSDYKKVCSIRPAIK